MPELIGNVMGKAYQEGGKSFEALWTQPGLTRPSMNSMTLTKNTMLWVSGLIRMFM